MTVNRIKRRPPNEAIKQFLKRNKEQQLMGQSYRPYHKESKDSMIECALCLATKNLHNHRITPHGIYSAENCYVCCAKCHKFIHSVYNRLKYVDLSFKMKLTIAISEYKDRANGR